MMNLKGAAHMFDKTKFIDSYGTTSFYAQLLPFPDSTRSGASSRRRILEVAPGIFIPVKMTVREAETGQNFILSGPAYDYYKGSLIRVKYPVLPVDHIFSIRSIGQVLANSGGVVDAYVSPSYIRRVIMEDKSDYDGGYEMFHSNYFTVTAGQIFYGDGRYYRARENSRVDDIGLGVTEAAELHNPLGTATFTHAGVYDPVTETYTGGTVTNNVTTFTEHITLDYVNEALGFVKIEDGDKTISFLKSQVTSAKVGDVIAGYKILSVTDNSTYWTAHCRRV